MLNEIVACLNFVQGYFRKAEVESQTFRLGEALQSYNKALSLQPNEPTILEAMNRVSQLLIKDKRGIISIMFR